MIQHMGVMFLALTCRQPVSQPRRRAGDLCLTEADRLPTVSAAAVVDDLYNNNDAFISTGLKALDVALISTAPDFRSSEKLTGGLRRGQLTEIWGPPGSGKTAFGSVIP
jgi:hypothetical protein